MLFNIISTVLLKSSSEYPAFSWDFQDLSSLGIRLSINLAVLYVIVRLLYYPKTKRKDYLFTYFLALPMFNILNDKLHVCKVP